MTINAQNLAAAALRAAANALDPQTGTAGGMGGPVAQPAAIPAQPAPVAAAQTATQAVTANQLTDLIMPHIGNAAIKEALGKAMRANGVANLPEAQPHQYAALYAAFQQVLAQHGVGAAPAAAQASTSII